MKRGYVVALLLAALSVAAVGQKGGIVPHRGTLASWAQRANQGFSMTLWLSNQLVMGLQAWDAGSGMEIPQSPHYGLEYPVGSGIEHLYAASPWVGAIVNGVRRVSNAFDGNAGTMDFVPSGSHPLLERIWHTSTLRTHEPNRREVDDDGDGTVDEDELDGIDNDGDWILATDDVGSDGIADAMESGCHGGYDATLNPDPASDNLDPSRFDDCHPLSNGSWRRQDDPDLYTERNMRPDHGEPHVDEDYGAVSESDFLLSATDTIPTERHVPLDVKLIQKSYAWSSRAGEAILPMEYTLINIGQNVLREGRVGLYVDADIWTPGNGAGFLRNFSCELDTVKTAYTHNPVNGGLTPIGVTALGVKGASAFPYFWVRRYNLDDVPPGPNDSLVWVFPPIPPDWPVPCDPNKVGDTRFSVSVGGFEELAPGDSMTFSLALVSGLGVEMGDRSMRANAERAIVLFDRGYHLPSAPPSPKVRLTSDERTVRLDWAYDGTGPNPIDHVDPYDKLLAALPDTHWRRANNPDPEGRGGRSFEGFTVWRSSSAVFDSASFVPIARFDVADDLGYGMQTGLRYSYVDSTASPGRPYWYAVTSYSVPSEVPLAAYPTDPVTARAEAPGVESSVSDNALRLMFGYGTAAAPGKVLVVPNPYRADNHYPGGHGVPAFEGAFQGDNGLIWFIHLPAKATIRVYSLIGDAIATIDHDDASRSARGLYPGQEEWRILSDSGLPLASGVYVFAVETDRETQIGKFVILR